MAMKSICETFPVSDAKTDYQNAVKIGAYRIGASALYFPGFPETQYLPLAAIRRAWVQKSTISTKGSCGAQLPVYVLRTQYEGGLSQNFTFSKPEAADRAVALLKERLPDLSGAPEKGE